jgi:hypothetical protein
MSTHEHKGWYVPRGLPHFDAPGVVQAITFRLVDSLPHGKAKAATPTAGALPRRSMPVAARVFCVSRRSPASSKARCSTARGGNTS